MLVRETKKVRPIVEDLLFHKDLKKDKEMADKFYEILLDFSYLGNNTICTRFGHESEYLANKKLVQEFMEIYHEIPLHLWTSLEMEGIVLTDPRYQPRSNKSHGKRILGHYIGRINRLVMFTGSKEEVFRSTVIHELAHAISDHHGRGTSDLKWKNINFDFDINLGWVPDNKKWFPTNYAKANPEEFFAESFTCYFYEECKSKMKKNNKETYVIIEKLIHPDQKEN